MSRSSPETVRADLVALLTERAARGNDYVKTAHLVDRTDYTPQQVGCNLTVLAERSDVIGKWSRGGNGTVWRLNHDALGVDE